MHKYKFKDLQNHCFDLSHFCIYIYRRLPDKVYLKTCAEWLRLASRIKKVQLESYSKERIHSDIDDIFYYMRDGKDHASADHVFNLTLFSLIWSAYEFILHDNSVNPEIRQIGKILKNSYEPHKNLIGLNSLVHELKHQLRYSAVIRSQKIDGHIQIASRSSRGINIVSQIRNHFAHLKDQFPVGMDDHEKNSIEKRIIQLSSRLILLTIQMLFLAILPENQEYIDHWWRAPLARERKVIHSFLRTVHLQ